MIRVDEKKCIRCYKCLRVCPFSVLEKSKNDIPAVVEGKNCMECMHCAAICPVNAITFSGKAAITGEKIKDLSQGFTEELKQHVMTRRSIRHFQKKPVDKELLTDILNTVRWAPSAKNQHPTKWIIINSKEIVDKMMDIILEYTRETGISPEIISEYEAGNNIVMGEAGTLLVAYGKDNNVNPTGDTYIAMATAELLMQAEGLGTCWCGYLTRSFKTMPKLMELLPPIPEGYSIYASMTVGYPKNEKYKNIPVRLNTVDIQWIE